MRHPLALLRARGASLLSSWALVNAGDAAGDYGFWFPGSRHDGAAGWGFCPQRVGPEWNRGCWDPNLGGVPRGIWPVDGEIDHGLAAGVAAACTVVLDDPVFGLMAYGGRLTTRDGRIRVLCRDGVRQRLHLLGGGIRFHLTLDRDGFARDVPVTCARDLQTLAFTLESRSRVAHTTAVSLQGLPPGPYRVAVDGKEAAGLTATPGGGCVVAIPIAAETRETRVVITRGVSERASGPERPAALQRSGVRSRQ